MSSAPATAPLVPKTTRVVVLDKAESGYRWKTVEKEIPEPGPRQVLIRVHAVSLNRGDLEMLEPSRGADLSGLVVASDAAGEILRVGREVKDFKPAMRVTTLYFRNYYEAFPTELVRAAQIDGASFFQIFWRILLPSSGPIIVVSVIWQFTNIWNDFLFGASFSGPYSTPMTVALNNLVSSSTGVKEYNVHFAGAILAALPTLIVYIVSGRYFVRGLMSGAVKG